MLAQIKDFALSEDGATAIEYGLIAALIALAIIGGVSALGGSNGGMWDNLTKDVNAGIDQGMASGG